MRIKVIIFFILGLILSCRHHNKKATDIDDTSNISTIHIVFYKWPVISMVTIECGMLPHSADIGNRSVDAPDESFKPFVDTTLQDINLLKAIEKRLYLLEIDTTAIYGGGNVQIQCIINFKDGTTSLLCLELYDIQLEGKVMLYDKELDSLIKKNIGYYDRNPEIYQIQQEMWANPGNVPFAAKFHTIQKIHRKPKHYKQLFFQNERMNEI
jgi:hypothetical protein